MDLIVVVQYVILMNSKQIFIGHHFAYEYDPVWYTDDFGETWTASNSLMKAMDEAQLVEIGK